MRANWQRHWGLRRLNSLSAPLHFGKSKGGTNKNVIQGLSYYMGVGVLLFWVLLILDHGKFFRTYFFPSFPNLISHACKTSYVVFCVPMVMSWDEAWLAGSRERTSEGKSLSWKEWSGLFLSLPLKLEEQTARTEEAGGQCRHKRRRLQLSRTGRTVFFYIRALLDGSVVISISELRVI